MTDVAKPSRTQLRVGRLVKAHGLKGALKIELYTDEPDRRFATGATFTLQVPESSPWHGRPLTVREFRWMNSHPVAFFEGVDDRSAAEELVKAILWIDEDSEASVPEDDAWYDHQLVGLDVVRDGEVVGTVARVDHFPAQDLLAVRVGEEEILVPFVKAIVPEVDIEAGRVVVTPPAGLFEALEGEEKDASSVSSDVDDADAADAADESDTDEESAVDDDSATDDDSVTDDSDDADTAGR